MHADRQTDRQTDIRTDRQTDRQRQTDTGRQAVRQTDRQTSRFRFNLKPDANAGGRQSPGKVFRFQELRLRSLSATIALTLFWTEKPP